LRFLRELRIRRSWRRKGTSSIFRGILRFSKAYRIQFHRSRFNEIKCQLQRGIQ
jgi:hypothetical protein